jgi:hypothetical protein
MSAQWTWCPINEWTSVWDAPIEPLGTFTIYSQIPGRVDWQAIGPILPWVASGEVEAGSVDGTIAWTGMIGTPYVHINLQAKQGTGLYLRVGL